MKGSKRDAVVKNRFLDYVGEGEGDMIQENSTEICILPYVKQMPIASSMHEAGYTKLVLWDNAEAWGRERGGEGFRMGGHLWWIFNSFCCNGEWD